MQKRQARDSDDARLLTLDGGCAYTSLGRTYFREWATEIGAVRRFGRSVRYDRNVIDAAIDAQSVKEE